MGKCVTCGGRKFHHDYCPSHEGHKPLVDEAVEAMPEEIYYGEHKTDSGIIMHFASLTPATYSKTRYIRADGFEKYLADRADDRLAELQQNAQRGDALRIFNDATRQEKFPNGESVHLTFWLQERIREALTPNKKDLRLEVSCLIEKAMTDLGTSSFAHKVLTEALTLIRSTQK